MKSKSMKIILGVAAIVALTSSLALARPGGGPGGPGGPGRGPGDGPGDGCPGYGPYAQVAPEKQEAFKAFLKDHFTKTAPLMAQMRAKDAELDALILDPKADQAKIAAAAKELAALKGKFIEERTDFRIKAYKEYGFLPGGPGGPGGGFGPGGGRGPGGPGGCGRCN